MFLTLVSNNVLKDDIVFDSIVMHILMLLHFADDNRARRKSTEPSTSSSNSVVVSLECALICVMYIAHLVPVRKCTH